MPQPVILVFGGNAPDALCPLQAVQRPIGIAVFQRPVLHKLRQVPPPVILIQCLPLAVPFCHQLVQRVVGVFCPLAPFRQLRPVPECVIPVAPQEPPVLPRLREPSQRVVHVGVLPALFPKAPPLLPDPGLVPCRVVLVHILIYNPLAVHVREPCDATLPVVCICGACSV